MQASPRSTSRQVIDIAIPCKIEPAARDHPADIAEVHKIIFVIMTLTFNPGLGNPCALPLKDGIRER
jgi:hypothetical protein